jgi:hypothetical protein
MLLARLCQCGRLAQQGLRPAASFAAAPLAVSRKLHTQEQHHRGAQAGASSSRRSLSSAHEQSDRGSFEDGFETHSLSFDDRVFASSKRQKPAAVQALEDLNDEDDEGFITEDDHSDDEGAAGQVLV